MDRILVLLQSENVDYVSVRFASFLGKLTGALIAGIFVDNESINRGVDRPTASFVSKRMAEFEQKSQPRRDEIIAECTAICSVDGVGFSILESHASPARELLLECRFANALVADATMSFGKEHDRLRGFMKDLLKLSECPVIMAPVSFEEVDEIVFVYDGSADSVFAIRQFTCLFPALSHLKTVLVQTAGSERVRAEGTSRFIKWLTERYPAFESAQVKHVDAGLFEFIVKRRNLFVVIGARDKNDLARLFKSNSVELLIRIMDQPLFITHRFF